MKDFFARLGNNPKFNTLTKLAFYSLFVIAALILINTADVSEINNEIYNNNQDEVNKSIIVSLPSSYEYNYTINLDDKIYSYLGVVDKEIHMIKKNKDNNVTNYKYENNKYYIINDNVEDEVLESKVFDMVDYEYLKIDRINQYLENSEEHEGKHITYLKDSVTGEVTDVYIEIEKNQNNIRIDYSRLDDEYEKFVVEFEYKERKDEGESDEGKEE